MKIKGLVVVMLIAAGALFYAQATGAEGDAAAKAEVGKPAPDFALKDVYGNELKLSDFKGRYVVLEWINKGCPVSRGCHEAGKRTMQDTYKKYAGKGVVWLAIDTTAGAKPDENRVYSAEMGLAYPILHDTDGKVGRSYDAKHTPHMFVIDKDGKLAYDGAIDDRGKTNYVADALDALLAGKPVAKPKTESYGCGVKYPKGN
jgi:peroxiredoxin